MARGVTTLSHFKIMGIFCDAQGQLTPQSLFGFGRVLNSFVIVWLSSLIAMMKNIRSYTAQKNLRNTILFSIYRSVNHPKFNPNFKATHNDSECLLLLHHMKITLK